MATTSQSNVAVPIGIVSRNRAVYLDCTLRSLSATHLPSNVPVVVFDDASDDPATRAYLDSNEPVVTDHQWPREEAWRAAGLDFLPNSPKLHGIVNRVAVRRLASESCGVCNASCAAIEELFDRFPRAPGVIVLQDDVVFNFDWYQRLTSHARKAQAAPARIGLVAGMHFDRVFATQMYVMPAQVLLYYTAQCYYLTRPFYQRLRSWFRRKDHARADFDRQLCHLAQYNGFAVEVIRPFVCQHIGVDSSVRSDRSYFGDKNTLMRIGLSSRPPYVFADSVRDFLR